MNRGVHFKTECGSVLGENRLIAPLKPGLTLAPRLFGMVFFGVLCPILLGQRCPTELYMSYWRVCFRSWRETTRKPSNGRLRHFGNETRTWSIITQTVEFHHLGKWSKKAQAHVPLKVSNYGCKLFITRIEYLYIYIHIHQKNKQPCKQQLVYSRKGVSFLLRYKPRCTPSCKHRPLSWPSSRFLKFTRGGKQPHATTKPKS